MDRTWWREATTGSWRCGRRATSNSFTSTQAVTQASVPWTSHTTRGKALWQAAWAEPRAALNTRTVLFMTSRMLFPQDSDHRHGLRQHCGIQHRLQPLALRTPEQVLRWTARGRGGRGGERRKRGRGGDALCCVSATPGKLQAPSGRKIVPDLRLYSLGKFSWREDAGALVEYTSSKHTCTYTHTCNHRHIISRWHTPQPAEKPVRLQNGAKKRVEQTFRGWLHP